MHRKGNPFRRHPWSAFLTILHSALCPRRCVPWVAKPRRLAERWLAAALSRSLTATPPPETNQHIFFLKTASFCILFSSKGSRRWNLAGHLFKLSADASGSLHLSDSRSKLCLMTLVTNSGDCLLPGVFGFLQLLLVRLLATLIRVSLQRKLSICSAQLFCRRLAIHS